MKKASKLLALLLATTCILAGCGQQTNTPNADEVVDNSQVESTVEDTVESDAVADTEDI